MFLTTWGATIFFGVLFAIFFAIDKRRFINAILFLIFLWCLFWSIMAQVTTESAKVGIIAGVATLIFVGLLIIGMTVVYIADGVIALRREGFGLSNALSILFIIGMWLGFFFVIFSVLSDKFSGILLPFSVFIILAEIYIIVTFSALFLYAILYRHFPKSKDCDFVIIHGAGLLNGSEVSPLLAGRIDKGIYIYHRSGDKARIIASGGQGGDETVSEASAMHDYLITKGIPEDKILLEDQSKTTFENMENSKNIIDSLTDGNSKKARTIFVTSDYHVFRAGTYARKVHLKADGVGSKTASYYFPNAFIREYVAIMVKHKVIPVLLVVGLVLMLVIR